MSLQTNGNAENTQLSLAASIPEYDLLDIPDEQPYSPTFDDTIVALEPCQWLVPAAATTTEPTQNGNTMGLAQDPCHSPKNSCIDLIPVDWEIPDAADLNQAWITSLTHAQEDKVQALEQRVNALTTYVNALLTSLMH
ncbi:hypothetical protein H2199_003967 [Coniosporium tulheliwenetii]|uniref:Uncharacterized protein n=1 Tax=Coniosporium tulheliwenetii TaxID=3383036 RepID=A0ACC2Z952_9PEZI|nr:hypothetical protein H2199_003967 [Cladosporium sp. JES 115]